MQVNFTFAFILQWHHTPRNMRAAKDMQNYRRGYPVSHSTKCTLCSITEREEVKLYLHICFSVLFWQNLTDDECSEDKMNNLQFYLNKFPSSPDGNSLRYSYKMRSMFVKVRPVMWRFLYRPVQISTSNHFSRSGKTTTSGWREFTRTFSGTYLRIGVCVCGFVQSEGKKPVSS